LRYILEAIELAKRTALNEDIQIKSTLSIEHIMPQKWRTNWSIPGFNYQDDDDTDPEHITLKVKRDSVIDTLGNLTLLTGPLNSSVSNGPFSVKMPAVRAHSSLALNRELIEYEDWNEETISIRGMALFGTAKKIWIAPTRGVDQSAMNDLVGDGVKLPPDGTECKFTYAGVGHSGTIRKGHLIVEGIAQAFTTFSGASKTITRTNRNGWNDWHLRDPMVGWILADDWRRQQAAALATLENMED
jgi:hypothetical protein